MDFSEFIKLIPDQLMWLINSFLGGVLGLLIGLERSKRLKEAGMGTHFIVGFASALLTCISLSFKTGEYGDGARIAAQIISGIGFLGAGMIFFRRETLHGLTTAAGIWATSAIGMCAGRGLYILAVGATAIVLIIQLILHMRSVRSVNRQRLLLLKFVDDGIVSDQIRAYFGVTQFYRYKVTKKEDGLHVEAVVRPIQNYHAEELNKILLDYPNVFSIERLEDL